MIFDERKSYKPFEYNSITEPFINAIWSSHWTHNEFNFKSDVQDYMTVLNDQEREVIKRSVLLISQVEVSVKSYWSNIGRIIPKPEIADVGAVFGGNEVIHSRAYSHILTKLGLDGEFQHLLATGVVDNRVTYLRKYVNKVYKNDIKNIMYSLVLFTLFTENVSLFSQFFVILGFNRFNNILKDVANVVQYTSQEESIHAKFGITLINTIKSEYPELWDEEFVARIIHESQEAVSAEEEIIEWMIGDYKNDFLSKEILTSFIRHRINTSLEEIGIDFKFDIDPEDRDKIKWMDEEIYASSMTDFFFKKPINYAKKNKSFNASELF
jgi:ribonucleoside-diphosphate reductase beta chain